MRTSDGEWGRNPCNPSRAMKRFVCKNVIREAGEVVDPPEVDPPTKREYVFVDKKKSWNDAKKHCIGEGMHLATIES